MLHFVADLTQSFFRNQDQTTRRKSKPTITHQYENLEARQLLASISFDASIGIVTLDGENTADVASVTPTTVGADAAFQFDLNGLSETFLAADVVSIFFEGNDGDDEFVNDTNLPSFARGGLGNDILTGGSGVDRLVGGNGEDLLTGNAGDDFLIGGQGSDTLAGNAGNDELFGEGGDDELFGGP